MNFMRSWRKDLTITTTEFVILADRARNGTPPGPGWGTYLEVVCDLCGYTWTEVAMIGSKGKTCPLCGVEDVEFVWGSDLDFGGDGSFLQPVGWKYATINHN